jgi:EmrB/QacA subfamily drug resistance transporter
MHPIHRGSKTITLLVTCLGSFMVLLDASIVTVALPTIQASLHASLSELQWAVDAYTLPFAALLLTTGTLSDRFGRKRLFLIGMVLFLLGSALCGLAPSFGWFLFGRVVQGMGGAALSPGSLAVLAAAFSDARERAQAIGIWSGLAGVALAVGPLVGGLLIEGAGWPAIFFVNLPIGLLALVLGLPGLAESRNPAARRIDLPGQVLITAGLTCLIMALIEGGALGWTSPTILGLSTGTVVFLAAFLLVEARMHEPLLPLSLFKSRVFSGANVGSTILGFAVLGTVFFMTQYFQGVQGYSALETGLLLLPMTMGTFLAAPLSGRLTARTSPRLPIVLGAVLSGTALLLLTDLSPVSSYATLWWKLGLLGVGIGLMMSPLTVAVLSATSAARSGLASSMVSVSRQVGSTLGVAVLGAFVFQGFSGNIATQLAQRGVAGPLGARIADKIAAAGAQASQLPLAGRLSLSQAALHLAFVDALRGSLLISSIGLFAVAVLVSILFQHRQRVLEASAQATGSQVRSDEPAVVAVEA